MGNITIPADMGMGTTEVDIIKWKVKKGDYVNLGDPVVEIESEKVSYTVESQISGFVNEILYKEGDTVPVGKEVCIIDEDAETK